MEKYIFFFYGKTKWSPCNWTRVSRYWNYFWALYLPYGAIYSLPKFKWLKRHHQERLYKDFIGKNRNNPTLYRTFRRLKILQFFGISCTNFGVSDFSSCEMFPQARSQFPYFQTQLQDRYRFTFSWPFSYIPFSSFTFTGATYRIYLLFLLWLPCRFYLVVIEQHGIYANFTDISTAVYYKVSKIRLNSSHIISWKS